MKINKLIENNDGFAFHYILPILVIAVIGLAGARIMFGSHAATPSDLSTASAAQIATNTFSNAYVKVAPITVKQTLSRDNPNIALMNKDHSGYQQGLIYGPGFKITALANTGFEVAYNQPTQAVGFFEGSGGMTSGQVQYIHTYINPNKPNGTYTGTAVLKYYVASSQQWLSGPTITYTIKLIDSVASQYISVSPTKITETLSRSKVNTATGLIMGSNLTINNVYPGLSGFEIIDNQPTQGIGYYETSGGLQAKQVLQDPTYINPGNHVNGTYTGTANVQYYVNSLSKWEPGPTISYEITLTN